MNRGGAAAIILFVICFSIGATIWGIDPDWENFIAASSKAGRPIKIDDVSCVSLRRVMYDTKPYPDHGLVESIGETFKIKTVLLEADDMTCPWGLSANALPWTSTAVTYNGLLTRYIVSIGICEKEADGRLSDRCLQKEMHVFSPRVAPRDLFRIGLVGLARPQTVQTEAFRVGKRP
jgi:hypothetical protein